MKNQKPTYKELAEAVLDLYSTAVINQSRGRSGEVKPQAETMDKVDGWDPYLTDIINGKIVQPPVGTLCPSFDGRDKASGGTLCMTMEGGTMTNNDTEEQWTILNVIPLGILCRSKQTGRDFRLDARDVLDLALAAGIDSPDVFPMEEFPEGWTRKPPQPAE